MISDSEPSSVPSSGIGCRIPPSETTGSRKCVKSGNESRLFTKIRSVPDRAIATAAERDRLGNPKFPGPNPRDAAESVPVMKPGKARRAVREIASAPEPRSGPEAGGDDNRTDFRFHSTGFRSACYSLGPVTPRRSKSARPVPDP